MVDEYISPSKLRLLGRWVQPTLSASFWLYWANTKSFERFSIPDIDGRIAYFDGNHFQLENDMKIIEEIGKKEAENGNKDYFNNFERIALEVLDSHLKMERECLKLFNEGSLQSASEKFILSMRETIAPWTLGIVLGYGVEKAMAEIISREKIDPLVAASYVQVSKPTYLMRYDNECKKIAKNLSEMGLLERITHLKTEEAMKLIEREAPAIHSEITSILNEFDWVGTHHFWAEGLTEHKLLHHLHEISSGKKEEKEKQETEAPSGKGIPFPFKVAGTLAYVRQYSAEVSDIVAFRMRPLLSAVRKEMKLKHENDDIWLTTKEFLEFFEGKGIPSQSEIDARKKLFGIIIEDGKEKAISGKEADVFLDKLLPKHDSNLTEWKGTVASKGKAVGKVRLIFVPEDCADFQKGEILVTNQTTPDFVPAMKRAAAIVTDEGGLTCHAAIVSRELGVPCIVGTKISTKVLKNGDKIEVDAEKGTIRKI